MANPQLVQPQVRTTPTDAGPVATPLPADFLADAVRRLRLACLVWMVLWATAVVVNHFILPSLNIRAGQAVPWTSVADGLATACILVSALVYRYAPIVGRRPEALVDLGIAYMVVLAFAIGVINQWQPLVLAGRLSWICALVLLHPIIVPGPPGKVLIGSLLAASMDPVASP
jgi:hypothetical protein